MTSKSVSNIVTSALNTLVEVILKNLDNDSILTILKSKETQKQLEKKLKTIIKTKKSNSLKRPTTGYIIYCSEYRSKIKEDNPDLSPQEITKELGSMWKKCKNKEKYNTLANEDKIRYKKEKEDQKSSKKPKPKSAYLYFCIDFRDTIKEQNPDSTPQEITKKLGKLWKEIKNTSKTDKYRELARKELELYKESSGEKSVKKSTKGEKSSKKEKVSDLGSFIKDNIEEVKKANPSWDNLKATNHLRKIYKNK